MRENKERMQRILIIHPLKYWQMNAANVHLAMVEDETVRVRGRLTNDELADDDTKTGYLLKLCESMSEDSLFEDIGRRKFRKAETFWNEADDAYKSYMQRIVGQRLLEAIRRAEALGMEIYYRAKSTDNIPVKQSLKLRNEEVYPVMHFAKSAEAITYSLTLKVDKETIVPAHSDLLILAYNPGVLRIKQNLYLMVQDFNAKIITPFVKKESTIIPLRMQNEYFRKFILKNASKAEIKAEGFNIEEQDVERKCMVCLERSFNDKASVTLRYRYGTTTYETDNRKKAAVNIVEDGEEVKLVKVTRSPKWESECRSAVQQIGREDFSKGFHVFSNMKVAVEWLQGIGDDLRQDERFLIQQNMSSAFYVDKFKVEKSKTWAGDWLNIRIAVVLADGTALPFVYFREAITSGQQEIALPNGDVFFIPAEWFATYGGLLMIASVNGNYFRVHKSQLSALNKEIIDIEEVNTTIGNDEQLSLEVPNTLHATLRSYQEEGFKWLSRNFDARTGCCLSDDMGLGKTIQTIALILRIKEMKDNLNDNLNDSSSKRKNVKTQKLKNASTPNSYGMMDMFANFFANETTDKQSDTFINKPTLIICPSSILFNWHNELRRFAPQLQVCSYTGTVAERKRKLENLALWDVVLTTYRTATNDIEDLCMLEYSMLVFDESQVFKNRNSQIYSAMLRLKSDHHLALSGTPMENSLPELWSLMNILNPLLLGDFKTFQKYFISPITDNLEDVRSQILRRTIAPYFLRRTKEQVLTDLPDRQDEIVYCEMSEEQQQMYNEELSKARNLATDHSTGNELIMLSAINRLRQIACSPKLIKDKDAEDEGKLPTIFLQLEELRSTAHKVLLFSEYVSFLNLIAKEMEKRHWRYDILTGETRNREQIINHFSTSADTQFFLVSLKAGGVGLNLTCADYVFILDPWWNKSAEEQAISRAHRIGQKHSVFVYRFITKDTLEEKILQLQEYKTSLIETVMPFLK